MKTITLSPAHRATFLIALGVVLLSFPSLGEKDESHDFDKAVGTVTLTNGTGDGQLAVEVDGYGSFGSSVETSSGARYNPDGTLGIGQTTFESALFFADMVDRAGITEFRDFLTTDDFGADLAHIDITGTATTASSSFTVSQYAVTLQQTLETLPSTGGSRLTQQYTIVNNTGQQGNLKLVRFLDGDLCFVSDCVSTTSPEWQNDFAGASSDFRTLYAFDSGDSFTDPLTAISVERSANRTPTSSYYAVQPFRTEDELNDRMSDRIDAQNGIPATARNKIYKDASPADRLTDSAYDPTLSFEDSFSIEPGGSLVYTTVTTWGENSIGSVFPSAIFSHGFDNGNFTGWSQVCSGGSC